jgi:hypothetical protein
MANPVWHTQLGIELDLTRHDLGHPGRTGLWGELYEEDRLYASQRVRVSDRGLQCAGVCRDAGVTAWMYLRQRADGRREAVHEHAEDERRHRAAGMSDEHKAYQERVVRVAESAGHRAEAEVTPRGGRIRTDALVHGPGNLRVGWEIQRTDINAATVRRRIGLARDRGITPAWHTDRTDFDRRQETHWTRTDKLPPEIIRRRGDLVVWTGVRAIDWWRCDSSSRIPCPDRGHGRCNDLHPSPKPAPVQFDDLVRKTAAGVLVPLVFRTPTVTHRFWVSDADRDRYLDNTGQRVADAAWDTSDAPARGRGSSDGPTCRPRITLTATSGPVLDWGDRKHWSDQTGPCRHCGKQTNLRDDTGVACHKICQEATAAV